MDSSFNVFFSTRITVRLSGTEKKDYSRNKSDRFRLFLKMSRTKLPCCVCRVVAIFQIVFESFCNNEYIKDIPSSLTALFTF